MLWRRFSILAAISDNDNRNDNGKNVSSGDGNGITKGNNDNSCNDHNIDNSENGDGGDKSGPNGDSDCSGNSGIDGSNGAVNDSNEREVNCRLPCGRLFKLSEHTSYTQKYSYIAKKYCPSCFKEDRYGIRSNVNQS